MRSGAALLVWLCCFAMGGAIARADDGQAGHGGVESTSEKIAVLRAMRSREGDAGLRRMAVERAKDADMIGAFQTLGYVRDPRELSAGLAEFRALPNNALSAAGGSRQSYGVPHDRPAEIVGASGGGSFADFASLIDLIQTTVVPDTWEALGGPSTMSPYPAGIMVDGNGLVRDITTEAGGSAADNLSVMLNAKRDAIEAGVPQTEPDWRAATIMRAVSLSRLSQEVLRRRLSGKALDDSMSNMAGLSRIQYVVLDPENRDVILAGPVGGIETFKGWHRDQKTGLTAMRLEYFATAFTSILSGTPFGCTIDPTPNSLASAVRAAESIRSGETPIGLAAQAMQDAIGKQDVRVFGTAGDTALGYLMVEADRHMKQLALGVHPLPKDAPNYLDFITRHIASGPPDGQLLRLWFTGSPMAVRVDEAGRTYELAGRAMKLVNETKLARTDGGRGEVRADVRSDEFVDEFNKRFIDIVAEYPLYGALHSVYASAAVAEVLRRSEAGKWIPGIVAPMLLHDSSDGLMPTPRKVDSLAVLHRVTHQRKRHSIVVASGGVMVEASETVEADFRPYASLISMRERLSEVGGESKPDTPATGSERWWWNAD
jgi:hypothetical protein